MIKSRLKCCPLCCLDTLQPDYGPFLSRGFLEALNHLNYVTLDITILSNFILEHLLKEKRLFFPPDPVWAVNQMKSNYLKYVLKYIYIKILFCYSKMPQSIKITFPKENIFRLLSAGHVLSQF